MKISELIKILKKAKRDFGDVPVQLMDEQTGNWHNVKSVLKLHPYTNPYGCMNRAEAVNAIAIDRGGGHAEDLILNPPNVEVTREMGASPSR